MIQGRGSDVIGIGIPSMAATANVEGNVAAKPVRPLISSPGISSALAFSQLCADAAACQRCPTMSGRPRILSPANGGPGARVIFIGEAPGRLGGDRTGVPFSGDQSGRNFERLLAAANLTRAEVFVTNAILCNPRDEGGRNRGPSCQELASCGDLLARQLAVIDAPVVVTLGAVALKALDALAAHGLQLREAVGQMVPWQGRLLMPLYHPGPRAQLHRSFALQHDDFTALGKLVHSSEEGTFTPRDAF
jgi:uracil-DNA glycosylase family 4